MRIEVERCHPDHLVDTYSIVLTREEAIEVSKGSIGVASKALRLLADAVEREEKPVDER